MLKRLVALLAVCSLLLHAQESKVLEWRFKDGLQDWRIGGFESHEIIPNGFKGKVRRDAMLFSPILNIEAADYDTLEVVMKSDLSAGGEIFVRAKDEVFREIKYRHHRVHASEEFLLYSLNLSGIKGWEGVIEQIRFDPINPASEIAIKSIRILKTGKTKDSITAEDGKGPFNLPYKEGVIAWYFNKGLQGWSVASCDNIEIREDGFHGLTRRDCRFTSPALNIKASEFDVMFVGIQSDTSDGGELYIEGNGIPFSDKYKRKHFLHKSDKLSLLRIDLKDAPAWNGVIDRVRFDPLNIEGATLHVSFILLANNGDNSIPNGNCELFLNGTLYGWELQGAVAADEGFNGMKCIAFNKGDVAETPLPNVSFLGTSGISFMSKGAPIQAEVIFLNQDNTPCQSIPIQVPQADEWQETKAEVTIPDMAFDGLLRFTATGPSRLDAVKCTTIRDGTCLTLPGYQPSWSGKWIWCEQNKQADDCTAYLRKTITLPDKKLASAEVELTCDDSYALYVNGQFVHSTHGQNDAWKKPGILNLLKFLKPGENTIFVEAKDVGSQQGFIAEFVVSTEDGDFISTVTDSDWEAALDKNGPWEPAAVLGQPPCPPWGYAYYRPMRIQPIIVKELKAAFKNLPKTITPGQTLALEMDIQVGNLPRPLATRSIVRQNGEILTEEWSHDGLRTVDGKPQLELNAHFPLKLKPGTCTLTVEFLGAPSACQLSAELPIVTNPKTSYEFPKVELVSQNGVTNILVNGQLIDPTQALFTKPDKNQQVYTRDAGIHLWGIGGSDLGFTEHGFDYSSFDSQIEKYLAVDPDAWLIINYSINTRVHQWWMKKHPEACCRYENGSDTVNDYRSSKGYRPAYASPVWRETFGDVLRRFIDHLKSMPYAERIVGFHSINGISAEWFHWGSQNRNFVDYSDASREDFRRWLKAKYKSDEALQKAWARPDVTLATAAIPTGQERGTSANGLYFDPKTQMNVLDYNDYQHDNCVDTINYFNRVVKEATGGRVLCGTYYGYTFNLFDSPFFGQGSGHYRLGTMLQSKEFDYCIAPDCYGERQRGAVSKTMTTGGAYRLHGKFFWNQADLRSHWAYGKDHLATIQTVQDSIDCMEREFARCISEGNGIQWYDFSNGWTMGDKRLMKEAAKLYDLSCRYRNAVKDWAPENYLLVVLDERFMGRWNAYTNVGGNELHQNQNTYLWQAGLPWRVVLFSDLLRYPQLLNHKAMLFVDAYRLTDEYKAFLEAKVLKDGRSVAFVGCPGMLTPDGLSADYCSSLMGCEFKVIDEPTHLFSTGNNTWQDLEGKSWGHNSSYKSTQFLMPENTRGCEVLATLADGRPSALYKQSSQCNIFWSAAPGLKPAVLRAFARRAGLPVLATGDDGLYAGLGFIGFYATTEGEKEITLLGKGTPKELLSGQTWPKGTTTIKLPMRVGETKVFIVE